MYRKVVRQERGSLSAETDVHRLHSAQTRAEIRMTGTLFSFLRERVWHKENLCTDMIRSTCAC